MPDKRCPNCRLWNTDSAVWCDCGFGFRGGVVRSHLARVERGSSGATGFGTVVAGIFGLALGACAGGGLALWGFVLRGDEGDEMAMLVLLPAGAIAGSVAGLLVALFASTRAKRLAVGAALVVSVPMLYWLWLEMGGATPAASPVPGPLPSPTVSSWSR